ncbi:Glycogen synthase kinase-3 alpha [Taenia crassiceps]|uniref:Glycogen synthase kinase-3 alpha n=1 Tax=Taenia crassiceps TaxID=6207 RepID=A0ABR4Q803_9CEST
MSLASRHSGATQGSNHTNANNASKPAHGKSNRMGGPFAGLISGRLALPRQLGTFGQIEKATLTTPPPSKSADEKSSSSATANSSDSTVLSVAVKRVLQDPRYKNRELSIMQKLSRHPNVVKFYYYYFSTSSSASRTRSRNSQQPCEGVCTDMPPNADMDVYLHLVLECFPGSLCELVYMYFQRNMSIPPLTVKLFTYQMLKALAYLHSHQICHRDLKSSNLLVNEQTMVLKLCDFGSAKEMVPGTTNVSYISSRYYRAPELLFGAQMYTCAIDTWGAGCVLAEMLRHQCLFTGADSVDQLVKVIRVLGTPTAEDIASMNPMYESYNFPDVQSCPVKLFFPRHTPADLLALMSKMLVYNPNNRLPPRQGLLDRAFDEIRDLRASGGKLPNGNPLPPHLFDSDPPDFSQSAAGDKPSTAASSVQRKESAGKHSTDIKARSNEVSGGSNNGGHQESSNEVDPGTAGNDSSKSTEGAKQASETLTGNIS